MNLELLYAGKKKGCTIEYHLDHARVMIAVAVSEDGLGNKSRVDALHKSQSTRLARLWRTCTEKARAAARSGEETPSSAWEGPP